MKNLIDILQQRGLIAQMSHEDELKQILDSEQLKKNMNAIYVGIDPTAPSLHLGNLVPLMMLRHAQEIGFVPIVVFGGATGLIGDPTGRLEMRPMHSQEQIFLFIENFKKLALKYFLPDVPNQVVFLNNYDWIGPMTWIQFARDVGVHFTIAKLLSAEVNKTRYQEGGLTFMELGYQLLQAYDFLHLFKMYNCVIQVGGSDQWSNILAGAELIRRVMHEKAFALTAPLLLTSDGSKFGKSAGNAIWLDPSMTSPFEFFQYFRNAQDADVEKLFLVFTFLNLTEIEKILSTKEINKQKEMLAFEVTKFIHGNEEAEKALKTSKNLFSGENISNVSAVPKIHVNLLEMEKGIDILDSIIRANFAQSRSEARKLMLGGGFYYNGQKFSDVHYQIKKEDFLENQGGILLRKGKKDYILVIHDNSHSSHTRSPSGNH